MDPSVWCGVVWCGEQDRRNDVQRKGKMGSIRKRERGR
jgi:hypothetical protein